MQGKTRFRATEKMCGNAIKCGKILNLKYELFVFHCYQVLISTINIFLDPINKNTSGNYIKLKRVSFYHSRVHILLVYLGFTVISSRIRLSIPYCNQSSNKKAPT